MPERLCATCSRPPGAGMVLCAGCGDRLADHLYAVPDLLAELDIARAHLDVLIVTAGRGGEQGLPFDQDAAAAYDRLLATIDRWTIQLACTRAALEGLPASGGTAALWLARRLDWLRALEDAGDAYCELDAVVRRAWHAVDRPPHRTAFAVGPCPERRETSYCPGQVWAYIPVRVDTDPAVLRCRDPECPRYHRPWTTEQWRVAGVRILRRAHGVIHGSGDRPNRRPTHRSP